MALELGSVAQGSNSVAVAVAADGSPADAFDLSGIKLEAGVTYRFQSPDGAAQTLDISTWNFDSTATPSNPITIQIQGFACTLIVPASETSRIDGGGFSGTGAVVIEAISPFWTPGELTNIVHYTPGKADTYNDTTFTIAAEFETGLLVGSNTLSNIDVDKPTIDTVNGYADFVPNSKLNIDTPVDNVGSYWFLVNRDGGAYRDFLTNLNSDEYIQLDNGGLRGKKQSGTTNFTVVLNGDLDGSNLPDYLSGSVSNNSVQLNYPGGDRTNEWVLIIANLNNEDAFEKIGDSSAQFLLGALGMSTSVLTTDEVFRLQGYMVWKMVADGFIGSGDVSGNYLNVNHPYINGPPLSAGGGTSSVTVQVPTTTFTVANLPIGSEVRIYDLDGILPSFGTELAGVENNTGTTFDYEHSKSDDDVMVQIFADGFKEVTEIVTLLSINQTFSPVFQSLE